MSSQEKSIRGENQTDHRDPPTKQNYALPISNGILEHREKIGSAIWLFILLIDWTTSEENGIGKVKGGKPIKIKELMLALRLRGRQISSQLQRLADGGYIRRKRTPYGYAIAVLKSKKFINRDRQSIAGLSLPDQQKAADPEEQEVAALNREIGNFVQGRSAIYCRNKEDLTVDLTNKNSASRKKRAHAANRDSRIQTLLTVFGQKFQIATRSPYVPVHGKDQALFKNLLAAGHEVPTIEAVMDRYFADDYYRKTGFDVGGFKSAFNRLNSAGAKKRHNFDEGGFPEL
jgi:hypothetical protein